MRLVPSQTTEGKACDATNGTKNSTKCTNQAPCPPPAALDLKSCCTITDKSGIEVHNSARTKSKALKKGETYTVSWDVTPADGWVHLYQYERNNRVNTYKKITVSCLPLHTRLRADRTQVWCRSLSIRE
jgi:hypothetical protein